MVHPKLWFVPILIISMVCILQLLKRWFFLFGSVLCLFAAIPVTVFFALAVIGSLNLPPAVNMMAGLDAFIFAVVLWMFAYTWYRIAGGQSASMQFRWRRIPGLFAFMTLALIFVAAILFIAGA